MRASAISLGVVIGLAALAACGPPPPYVRYSGNSAQRPHRPANAIEVHRAEPPSDDVRPLGTVNVTCPSEAQAQFGGITMVGGCTYERAIQLAQTRASELGADGIHSIETGSNSAGSVVSLRATVFYYAAAPRPKAAMPAAAAPAPNGEEQGDVAERLRRLDKLKAEQLITPEEYAEKRAQILKEL